MRLPAPDSRKEGLRTWTQVLFFRLPFAAPAIVAIPLGFAGGKIQERLEKIIGKLRLRRSAGGGGETAWVAARRNFFFHYKQLLSSVREMTQPL